MKTRRLGNTDLDITALGFGTWAIGGGEGKSLWGAKADDDPVAAIHRALDEGINWIDTAAVYGLGRSEEIVGEAIKGRSKKPYVFTKGTLVPQPDGLVKRTYKHLRQELEASLSRLGLETVDLYQCHWPIADLDDMEEGWAVMADLQREGKIRWIGVSNYSVEEMQQAMSVMPVHTLQPPYSLVTRGIEKDVLPFCEAHGIGVIAYAAMQSGLLSGAMSPERLEGLPAEDWRRRNRNFQEPLFSKHLQLVELLREIGQPHGRAPGEVAVAWTLRKSGVTAAIVGARNAQQIDGWIGAAECRLSPAEQERIQVFLDTELPAA